MFELNANASRASRFIPALGLLVALTACSGSDNGVKRNAFGTGGSSGATGAPGPVGTAGSNTIVASNGGAAPVGAGGVPQGPSGSTTMTPTGAAGMTILPPTGMGGTLGMGGMIGVGPGGNMGLAGMLGTAGMGGPVNTAGASGGGAGGAPPMHPDLGVGDGSDVVLLGDSWMSNTLQVEGTGGGLAPSLIAVAKKPYRNYAVQGVMLLQADAFGPAIPSQWDQAKAVNPNIKTVVMTGGGNDLIQNPTLQTACQQGTDACTMLFAQISDGLNALWTKMADGNVQDIVLVQYATDVGTVNPSVRSSIKTPSICLSGRIRCHSVDSTSAIMKQIAADGIHPLQQANARLAQVVYDLMTSQGIRR